MSGLSSPPDESAGKPVVTPVLQISRPPDQGGDDSSTSEYESFPDTASDHEEPFKFNTKQADDVVKENLDPNSNKQSETSQQISQISDTKATGESPRVSPVNVEQDAEGLPDVKDWAPPNDELQDKIVKQVEFYFSDANITKDAFLLKHIRRNKHGFVSIKLISSFKKIKKLTQDWNDVSYSLKSSEELEVNTEGTKVKRRKPLPEIDLSAPLRTVVVVNFSDENPTIESVTDMFQHCGKINLVRVIKPNKPFPPDVQKHMQSHHQVQDKVCGLVEFEKQESAQKAVKTMSSEENWRTGLLVSILSQFTPKKKGKERSQQDHHSGHEGHLSGGDAENEKSKQKKKKKKNKNRINELAHVTPSSSDCENSPSPNRRSNNSPIPIPNSHHLSPSGTPRSSPCQSPHGSPRGQRKFHGGRSPHTVSPHSSSPLARQAHPGSASPRGSPELRRKVHEKTSDRDGHSDSSNSPSPWFQRRRMLAAQSQEACSPGSSPMLTRRMISGAKPQMSGREGLLRTPKGPEPGKGFYQGAGRGKPTST